mgnify:CR=1 FL=1
MKNFNSINKIKNKLLKIIFNKTNQPNISLKIILALHLILYILDICLGTPYIIIFIQFFT